MEHLVHNTLASSDPNALPLGETMGASVYFELDGDSFFPSPVPELSPSLGSLDFFDDPIRMSSLSESDPTVLTNSGSVSFASLNALDTYEPFDAPTEDQVSEITEEGTIPQEIEPIAPVRPAKKTKTSNRSKASPKTFVSLPRDQLLLMTSDQLDEYIDQITSTHTALSKEEQKELKSMRRLVRNRESAQASRDRKKNKIDDLSSRVSDLKAEQASLENTISTSKAANKSLLEEVVRLQSMIRKSPALLSLWNSVHKNTTMKSLVAPSTAIVAPTESLSTTTTTTTTTSTMKDTVPTSKSAAIALLFLLQAYRSVFSSIVANNNVNTQQQLLQLQQQCQSNMQAFTQQHLEAALMDDGVMPSAMELDPSDFSNGGHKMLKRSFSCLEDLNQDLSKFNASNNSNGATTTALEPIVPSCSANTLHDNEAPVLLMIVPQSSLGQLVRNSVIANNAVILDIPSAMSQ